MSEQHPVRLTVDERGNRLIVHLGGADGHRIGRTRLSFRAWFRGHDVCVFRPATRDYSLPGHLRARLMDWIDGHLQDAEVSWPEQEARMREAAVREGVG